MIFHDFIIVAQEKSNSILKTNSENIGIVKEIGDGYYSDSGSFISNIRGYENGVGEPKNLIGKRILFTQHMELDIEGEKVYVVRGRDVIKVWS